MRNRNGKAGDNTIWALKDVSFDVQQGEVVGIIGRNGAGKSTLLKISQPHHRADDGARSHSGPGGEPARSGHRLSSRTDRPRKHLSQRRDPGHAQAEIKRKFDEIVAFAEVEKFLDTPVKRYSSGMYVRLAFAVAAHLEPEILIVDEVLAVGDRSFKKSAWARWTRSPGEGRTVLFVSHNMTAIQTLPGARYYSWMKVARLLTTKPAKPFPGICERPYPPSFAKYFWESPEKRAGETTRRDCDNARLIAEDGTRFRGITVRTPCGASLNSGTSSPARN